MLIKIAHMRKCKYCSKGVRAFFKKHNLDFSSFLENGIDEEKLLATKDAMAEKVVEVANGWK